MSDEQDIIVHIDDRVVDVRLHDCPPLVGDAARVIADVLAWCTPPPPSPAPPTRGPVESSSAGGVLVAQAEERGSISDTLAELDALREKAEGSDLLELTFQWELGRAYPALASELRRLAEENEMLLIALRLLRALPDTGPACSREEHDGSPCPDCAAQVEYQQRCLDVFAQADEALAAAGEKGAGKRWRTQ